MTPEEELEVEAMARSAIHCWQLELKPKPLFSTVACGRACKAAPADCFNMEVGLLVEQFGTVTIPDGPATSGASGTWADTGAFWNSITDDDDAGTAVVLRMPGLEITPADMGGGTDGEQLEEAEEEEAALGARKVPSGGSRGAGALRLSVPAEELVAILWC